MVLQFKLSKADGLIRRATFATRPSWSLLSSKIGILYDILPENVGVSYVDSDGDEVTLSSEEELQDFYRTLPAETGLVKFTVQDLGILRSTARPSPAPQSATAQQSHFRNTFGGNEGLPFIFEVDDEWQRLPGSLGNLFLSRDAPESPHAFVEVLESDASVSKHGDADRTEVGGATRSDSTFTMPGPAKDKGKERAATVEDDVSSAGSIIGNEAPSKPPVHVYDLSDTEDIFGRASETIHRHGAATPAQAQSTPVVPERPLSAGVLHNPQEPTSVAIDDDPPLPTVDFPDPSSRAPSLTHDVAGLLNTFSTVIAAHPELSEGIRNLVTNATNGTYWATHREAISRAAENIQRTAVQETGRTLEQIRRTAEEEAGERVADALGRVMRALGEALHPSSAHTAPFGATTTGAERVHSAATHVHDATHFPPTLPAAPDMHRDRRPWVDEDPFRGRFGHRFWGGSRCPPPPPPPPGFQRGWPRPPPRPWVDYSLSDELQFGGPEAQRETRAAAAEVLASAAEARSRAASAADARARASQRPAGNAFNPIFGNFEDAPVSPVQPSNIQSSRPTLGDMDISPEQLRAEVEQAKADYKARKERYRQAKAIRRAEHREKEQKSCTESPSISRQVSDAPGMSQPNTSVANSNVEMRGVNDAPIPIPEPVPARAAESAPPRASEPVVAPEVHIVSNARGPYPQLEMFSVPTRRHTMGHAYRVHTSLGHGHHGGRENHAFNRIMRKLSDMGFTEGAYTNLGGKVMDQLLAHPPTSKDAEDDIVTNMIEELIPSNGGLPHVSGSGGIPGAWH